MLERKGRLYRAGLTTSGTRILLGSVEEIQAGTLRSTMLSFPKVDKYILEPLEDDDDMLLCNIFVEEERSGFSQSRHQGPRASEQVRASYRD